MLFEGVLSHPNQKLAVNFAVSHCLRPAPSAPLRAVDYRNKLAAELGKDDETSLEGIARLDPPQKMPVAAL